MITIFLDRIREARIKNILDNCLATNEMFTKNDLRGEAEWFVDMYPGFPERSMHTGKYFYPLRPDPMDSSKLEAALADICNADYAGTRIVPNSIKKHDVVSRAPLRVHVDKQILHARRTIKRKTVGNQHAVKERPALRTSSFAVRLRSASTDSQPANITRTLLQVMDDEPTWEGDINEILGASVYIFILYLFYLIFINFLVVEVETDAKDNTYHDSTTEAMERCHFLFFLLIQ